MSQPPNTSLEPTRLALSVPLRPAWRDHESPVAQFLVVRPSMKRWVKFGVLLIVAVLLAGFVASYFYRRTHAGEIAFQMVAEDCGRQGLDTRFLTGPVDGRVGNTEASFSWDYHDASHHYEYLVSFRHFYDPELARRDYDRKN